MPTDTDRPVYDLYAGKKKLAAETGKFKEDSNDYEMFQYHILKRLEALEGK